VGRRVVPTRHVCAASHLALAAQHTLPITDATNRMQNALSVTPTGTGPCGRSEGADIVEEQRAKLCLTDAGCALQLAWSFAHSSDNLPQSMLSVVLRGGCPPVQPC
jgi:hypothetical protein